jgi:hypothetical protein
MPAMTGRSAAIMFARRLVSVRSSQTAKAPNPAVPQRPRDRALDTVFDYTDESGAVLYQVIKYKPKGFSQRRPDGNGGWITNLHGVRRVLYCLPELCNTRMAPSLSAKARRTPTASPVRTLRDNGSVRQMDGWLRPGGRWPRDHHSSRQ